MTNDRKELLNEKINAAFKALNDLSALITEEDKHWASNAYDTDMSDEDEQLVMGLINISDNLREMGYMFEM